MTSLLSGGRRPRPRPEVDVGDAAPPVVETVVVVVPARNEEGLLPRCLDSIGTAAGTWGGRVVVVVAADSCSDRSASVVRRHQAELDRSGAELSVSVVEGRWGRASRARHAAAARALGTVGPDLRRTWIASTDADCVVPPMWLARQVDEAARGAHVVLGTVALDAGASTRLADRFAGAYDNGTSTHCHVHAANLGLRADAFSSIGGWDPRIVVGEEHDLVRRATRAGLCIARPTEHVVTTSSRTSSRVQGGFASVLAQLALG